MKNWSKERLAAALKKNDDFHKIVFKRICHGSAKRLDKIIKNFPKSGQSKVTRRSKISTSKTNIYIGVKVIETNVQKKTKDPIDKLVDWGFEKGLGLKTEDVPFGFEDTPEGRVNKSDLEIKFKLNYLNFSKNFLQQRYTNLIFRDSQSTQLQMLKITINTDYTISIRGKNSHNYKIVFHKNIKEIWKVLSDDIDYSEKKEIEDEILSELKSLYKSKSEKQVLESKKIKSKMNDFTELYDSDKNNKLDILENDGFSALLKENQSKIINLDKLYILKFVKLSKYLKTKSNNLQQTYDLLIQSKKIKDFSKLQKIFDLQYESFSLLLFRSYEMVLSLIKEDLISFYEIYEIFDSVGVFESNWESEMKNTLSEIKILNAESVKSLLSISSQLQSLEMTMINQLSNINESIGDVKHSVDGVRVSIDNMNESLTKELKGVNNKLWWNNLFQVVQIYQNRKTNQLLGADLKLKSKMVDKKYIT
jgi:hypothetical protein